MSRYFNPPSILARHDWTWLPEQPRQEHKRAQQLIVLLLKQRADDGIGDHEFIAALSRIRWTTDCRLLLLLRQRETPHRYQESAQAG